MAGIGLDWGRLSVSPCCSRLNVRPDTKVELAGSLIGMVVRAGAPRPDIGRVEEFSHVTERGKYMNVWQQVNGSWKIKANMWNTDAPPSTPH